MRARVDRLGKLLLRSGALSEETLADVLDQQRQTFPLASLCYVLGHVEEETLVRALSKQCGVPGIVLEGSLIRLDVLEGVSRETAMRHNVLPVFEDERRIFVAAEDPEVAIGVLRELQFVRGKTVVPHIALHVTLARTIRACYAALETGQRFFAGSEADVREASDLGRMVVVSDVDTLPDNDTASRAHEAVIEDVTKELDIDILFIETPDTGVELEISTLDTQAVSDSGGFGTVTGADGSSVDGSATGKSTDLVLRAGTSTPVSQVELLSSTPSVAIDLDDGDGAAHPWAPGGPTRVLIVDDDFATRHLLVKELQPAGMATVTASSGGEAVRAIKLQPPDVVVIDVMLPEIDGFQICRAIKQSRKYNHIPVILMSAVIDSGRVTEDVLRRYGADAYFEKPLNTDRIRRSLKELLGARGRTDLGAEDDSFARAIALYKAGDVDGAVEELRAGLKVDPLSAKHHFVLANLLQKKSLLYEAIDEYEATIDLKPDYFPALTRLAYLYYRKGFSAKAIETWRRSLPHCPDTSLRQNIEVFMRKLIANMQSEL
jgi:CheY-like chemotaxis protein